MNENIKEPMLNLRPTKTSFCPLKTTIHQVKSTIRKLNPKKIFELYDNSLNLIYHFSLKTIYILLNFLRTYLF